MHVFRVSRKKHASALDGAGARIYGGRWNNVGVPCIYTSENRALAVLEYAVNVSLDDIPPGLVIITLQVPDDPRCILLPHDLPIGWNSNPAGEAARNFGSALLRDNKQLMLKVPSAVIPGEYNLIINPRHTDISKVKIINTIPFSLDTRLKK